MKEIVINLFYLVGSSTLGRFLARSFRGEATILMYHRVLPDEKAQKDRTSIAIGVSLFERQLKFLSRNYFCLSLDDFKLGLHLKQKKEAVVLTFDDGYKDNLTYALPLLEKCNVPATIYSVTRFLEGNTQMWWYEIFEILEKLETLNFVWKDKKWSFDLSSNELKLQCYKELRQLMIEEDLLGQDKLMSLIRGPIPIRLYSDDCLSIEELRRLDQSPLITIGAHTHNHGVLRQMNEEDLKDDINKSRNILEALLNHPILHFAYPFGSKVEADEREYRLADTLGFKTCVTTNCFPLTTSTPDCALPRVTVKQRTTERHLRAKISGWNSLWKGIQI